MEVKQPAPAEYWWLTQADTWIGLCGKHCAEWRESDSHGPPKRITNQRPPSGLGLAEFGAADNPASAVFGETVFPADNHCWPCTIDLIAVDYYPFPGSPMEAHRQWGSLTGPTSAP